MSMFGPKQNKGLFLALFFGVGTFLMLGWVLFQILVPIDVGKFGNIEVATNPIEAGSLQSYTAKECDQGDYQSVDIRQSIVSFSNPPEITLPVAGRYVTKNLLCTNIIIIPKETPQGEYRLQISVSYRVNPFQVQDRVYFSKPFVVTNNDPEFNILKAPEQQKFQDVVNPPGIINEGDSTQNLAPADNSSATPPETNPTTPDNPTPPSVTIPPGPVRQAVDQTVEDLFNITQPVRCGIPLRLLC